MPNGALDTTFSTLTFNIGEIWTSALQSDGKILIGSTSTSNHGVQKPGLDRFETNGSLDPTFQASGFTREGAGRAVEAMVVQNDGKIFISGRFRTGGIGPFAPRFPLLRLESNGSLDPSFAINASTTALG